MSEININSALTLADDDQKDSRNVFTPHIQRQSLIHNPLEHDTSAPTSDAVSHVKNTMSGGHFEVDPIDLELEQPTSEASEVSAVSKVSEITDVNEDSFVEHSVMEMGYNINELKHWPIVQKNSQTSLPAFWNQALRENKFCNCTVKIGRERFKCQSWVFCCYSKVFDMKDKNIELPSDKVTPSAFKFIHKWMLLETNVDPGKILEIYIAAEYLQISKLLTDCWAVLKNEALFCEDKAFKLCLKAHRHNLPRIEELVLCRIKKYFLSLIATDNFKELDFEQMRALLSSKYIAVNTETEVLFAAVYWLNHKWEEREQYTLELLESVRFILIPEQLLYSFKMNIDELSLEMKRVLGHRILQDIIFRAIAQRYFSQIKDAIHQDISFDLPQERMLVYDPKCAYHKQKTNRKLFSLEYKDFIKYMNELRTYGSQHWRTLQTLEDLTPAANVQSHSNVTTSKSRTGSDERYSEDLKKFDKFLESMNLMTFEPIDFSKPIAPQLVQGSSVQTFKSSTAESNDEDQSTSMDSLAFLLQSSTSNRFESLVTQDPSPCENLIQVDKLEKSIKLGQTTPSENLKKFDSNERFLKKSEQSMATDESTSPNALKGSEKSGPLGVKRNSYTREKDKKDERE